MARSMCNDDDTVLCPDLTCGDYIEWQVDRILLVGIVCPPDGTLIHLPAGIGPFLPIPAMN